MARDYRMISYLGGILIAWFNGMASKKLNVPESALLVAPGVKPCPKAPSSRLSGNASRHIPLPTSAHPKLRSCGDLRALG